MAFCALKPKDKISEAIEPHNKNGGRIAIQKPAAEEFDMHIQPLTMAMELSFERVDFFVKVCQQRPDRSAHYVLRLPISR